MDALLAMAHGFNDTRLAALRSSGQRPARQRPGAAAGGSDSDEEEDAEPAEEESVPIEFEAVEQSAPDRPQDLGSR